MRDPLPIDEALPEILGRAGPVGGYLWGWVRARVPAGARLPPGTARGPPERPSPASGRLRQPGDVNLSTLLSIVAFAGLLIAATT